MGENASNSLPAFGFLTVLNDSQHGYFGGYLLLSELGRPLEFHCSTPVLPNDAQKILYGASLQPYVLGELIGQTLVAEAKLPVQLVLTDQKDMLGISLLRTEPTVCLSEIEDCSIDCMESLDAPSFSLGKYRLFGTSTCDWQPDEINTAITPLTHYIDLSEPFQRIREAIREAQRITEHPGDDNHESSAAA